jgi:RNA:NAD 2'-phosphotransferase (TPT1/KptA family)
MNPCLSRLLSAVLIHQNKVLDVSLDISGHIETLINEISSGLQELRVRGDITLHVLRVLQSIRVHLHYPLHELDVV